MGIPLLLFRKPDKRRGASSAPVVPPLTFLFDDQFTTDDAAPLTIPRAAEPGPGAWNTLNDTGNRFSISGGLLVSATGGSGTDPNIYSAETFTRAIGKALGYALKTYNVTNLAGSMFRTNVASASMTAQAGIIPTGTATNIRNYNNASGPANIIQVPNLTGLDVRFYTILRTAGMWTVLWNGAAYKLIFVNPFGTWSDVGLHHGSDEASNLEWVRVAQLSSPWTDNDNLLTYRSATPSSGDTQVSTANAFHCITWTPDTNGTLDLIFRRTSDTAEWIVRASQASGTVKIYEDDGGEVERATAAVTIAAGTAYRIIARADAGYIQALVTTATSATGVGYTSATFNQTATATKILATNTTALADWEAWQVDIPTEAATELGRMSP